MKISGIYKIQSVLKSERIYIGSAVKINRRWFEHLSMLRNNKHHSSKLQRHFNKYGEADLQFSVILGCDKESLIKNEQFFIDSYNPYFNCCKIAGSSLGIKHSEIAKQKASILFKKQYENGRVHPMLGKHHTEESKKKISEGHMGISRNLGRKHSPESIKKMALIKTGKPKSEETRKKLSILTSGVNNPNYGKHHTPDACQRIRESRIGKHLSDDAKRKVSEFQKGRVKSEETKQKMRDSYAKRKAKEQLLATG